MDPDGFRFAGEEPAASPPPLRELEHRDGANRLALAARARFEARGIRVSAVIPAVSAYSAGFWQPRIASRRRA